MKICVCGWYFNDEFYSSLWRLNCSRALGGSRYPVFIIAHKDSESLGNYDLPYSVEENIGLEWGAYGQYLKKIWDGKDSVLFMHDDIKLLPLVVENEIKPGELIFDKLAKIQFDQAYVFQNRMEDVANYGRHGRMVYFSERLLRLIQSKKDFPWESGKEKVYFMLKYIQEWNPDWTLFKKVYFPNVEMAYEGSFGKLKEKIINEGLRIG